jgi:Glycosyl transferase family 2
MGKRRATCGGMEDCESSFTMRVRCRRGQLITAMAIPFLALFSFLTNAVITSFHSPIQDRFLIDSFTNQRDFTKEEMTAVEVDSTSGARQQTKRRKSKADESSRWSNRRRRLDIDPVDASLSPEASFSACLLIKDDNDILNEWIAYHYFVLKLRHLIVAIDPLSSQSPTTVLQKWSNLTDLEIVEWVDPDYMPAEFLSTGRTPRRYMQKASDFPSMSMSTLLEISNHRYRQRVFLAQCMKANRALNHSWVIHIDTDEYVVPSKLLRQMRPGSLTVPPMDEPGSVLKLLQDAVSKTSSLLNYPCISMLRVLFGSVESSNEEREHLVPESFNSSAFETLRWRYHGLPHNQSLHGNPKVILDVAAIPERFLPDVVFSIHRPVMEICSRHGDLAFTSFRKQPIAVNHYLGSWERYSERQDKRRSREKYDMRANQRRGVDDGVRPWLKGFVNMVGRDMAFDLLGEAYLARPSLALIDGRSNATGNMDGNGNLGNVSTAAS